MSAPEPDPLCGLSVIQAHCGRLRKLLATMQGNQDVYIQRALEFEAQVVRRASSHTRVCVRARGSCIMADNRCLHVQSTHLEQARHAETTAESTVRRLEAVRLESTKRGR